MAEESGPVVIVNGLFDGTIVATAAKEWRVVRNFQADTEHRIVRAFFHAANGPEYRPRHFRDFAPVHTGCQRSADNAAHAGTGHHRGLIPTSSSALITPMCASPRTAPPLRARPTRLDLSERRTSSMSDHYHIEKEEPKAEIEVRLID